MCLQTVGIQKATATTSGATHALLPLQPLLLVAVPLLQHLLPPQVSVLYNPEA